MNRGIEQALLGLIPRHNGPIPPELTDLAQSLLAQSRNKAANLKAEEEIARTYVCANIACERLKAKLNLPAIEPRPPCPPRTYKKLYKFLDGALVTRKVGRPPGTGASTSSSIGGQKIVKKNLDQTPSRTQALAQFQSPAAVRTPTTSSHWQSSTDTSIPVWIRPTIRALCIRLSVQAAGPHVLAGVSSIIHHEAINNGGGTKPDKLPALIAAIYFFVRIRLLGKETNTEEYITSRKEVVIELRDLRKADDGDAEQWKGWEDITVRDVDEWVRELAARGFLKMDWFLNIVEGSGLDAPGFEDEDQPTYGDEEEEIEYRKKHKDGPHTGLGSMIQKEDNYLDERKIEEYKIWEAQILARIDEKEKSQLRA